jgi:hypothetical protein
MLKQNALIERMWGGPDAITGKTADQFILEASAAENAPDFAKAAAISICRAYGICGICDPAYIANIINREINRLGPD